MTDQEEQSPKETKEQGRKKAYIDREEVIEKALKLQKIKRTEKHAAEGIEQLARDQKRKKTYFAKEQAIAEAQDARKLKAKKQTSE